MTALVSCAISAARPCHVVQVSFDDKVFRTSSESLARQVSSGAVLQALRPGSEMTMVVLTRNEAVHPFRMGNVSFVPFCADRRRWAKVKAWWRLYRMLERIDEGKRIDVLTTQTVHDEAWIGLLFARRKRRPVIGQIHTDIFNPHARAAFRVGLVGRIRYAFLTRLLKHFTALRPVGYGIANGILQRKLHRWVHVIPVTMPLLRTSMTMKSVAKGSHVLFVGRLSHEKNLRAWLDVAAVVADAVPESTFEIVGEGPMEPELRDLAVQKGLADRIHFAGFVDYFELGERYQAASVFLITSLYEGFGRVVAEALAHQLPVVASRIVGIEDVVVDGESGFLHAPTDVAGMAESVIRLLRDPKQAQAMGQRGQISVNREFNPDALAARWMGLLLHYANNGESVARSRSCP